MCIVNWAKVLFIPFNSHNNPQVIVTVEETEGPTW